MKLLSEGSFRRTWEIKEGEIFTQHARLFEAVALIPTSSLDESEATFPPEPLEHLMATLRLRISDKWEHDPEGGWRVQWGASLPAFNEHGILVGDFTQLIVEVKVWKKMGHPL